MNKKVSNSMIVVFKSILQHIKASSLYSEQLPSFIFCWSINSIVNNNVHCSYLYDCDYGLTKHYRL